MARLGIAAVVFVILAVYFSQRRRREEELSSSTINLTVSSGAFENGGVIPIRYTGRGDDVSPDLRLGSLSPNAKSIVVIMDDIDHPLGVYSHWVIWNLPIMEHIPSEIAHGETVPSLGGAVQGIGYGRHRYKGPKPPKALGAHRYQFKVFVLDCMLDLSSNSRKRQVVQAMKGHIVQHGVIVGSFKS